MGSGPPTCLLRAGQEFFGPRRAEQSICAAQLADGRPGYRAAAKSNRAK